MRDLLSDQKKAMIPVIVLFFHFTYAILFSHQNGVPPDIDVLNYIMPWGNGRYSQQFIFGVRIPDNIPMMRKQGIKHCQGQERSLHQMEICLQ